MKGMQAGIRDGFQTNKGKEDDTSLEAESD